MGEKIGIFGGGITGNSVYNYLKAIGDDPILFDERDGVGDYTYLDDKVLLDCEYIVFSPGFSLNHEWLHNAKALGIKCVGELEFAAARFKGKLVGITGTNGKSTLTSLLAQTFSTLAVGNIGRPLSDCLLSCNKEDAIVFCEISSFQAESVVNMKLYGLIWTNFYENHLDRHINLDEYFLAKWNLLRFVFDGPIILGETVLNYAESLNLNIPKDIIVAENEFSEDNQIKKGVFRSNPQKQNYLQAYAYCKYLGLNLNKLIEAAESFIPLPHRMNFVDEIKGVNFWNDSKGTTLSAAKSIILGFDDKIVWIGGGKEKGGDKVEFINSVNHKLVKACLIGETGPHLAAILKEKGVEANCYSTLEEALTAAAHFSKAKSIKNVLFCPGYSSFDMFDSYGDRGNKFKNCVLELKFKEHVF